MTKRRKLTMFSVWAGSSWSVVPAADVDDAKRRVLSRLGASDAALARMTATPATPSQVAAFKEIADGEHRWGAKTRDDLFTRHAAGTP